MIRINLLGAPKGKEQAIRDASAAAVMEVGDVGSPKLKILVVLVLAGLVNVGYWYQLDKQHRDIAAKMEVARAEEPRTGGREGALPGAPARSRKLQAPGGCDRPAARGPVRPGRPAEHDRRRR